MSSSEVEMNRDRLVNNEKRQTGSYKILTVSREASALGFENKSGIALGGGAAIAEMHTLGLRKLGHQAKIISPQPPGGYFPNSDSHLFLSSEIPWLRQPSDLNSHEQLVNEMSIAANNVNILYVSYFQTGGLISFLKESGRINSRVKFVYVGQTWGKMIENSIPGLSPLVARNQIEQTILNSADMVVVYTEVEKQQIISMYGLTQQDANKKIKVVPLGVDTAKFNAISRERDRHELRDRYLGIKSDTINFYSLARISPQKGQLESVMAFSNVMTRNPELPISLSLFGGAPNDSDSEKKTDYHKQLLNYLQDLSPNIRNSIFIHGPTPSLEACSVGDVFLGPSRYETWFLSMNEAMSCRLPTIISDIPVLREVAGEGSCFVNPTNGNTIEKAIYKMATDSDYRKKIGEYNYFRSQNYTWENSTRSLNEVFKSVMGQ